MTIKTIKGEHFAVAEKAKILFFHKEKKIMFLATFIGDLSPKWVRLDIDEVELISPFEIEVEEYENV